MFADIIMEAVGSTADKNSFGTISAFASKIREAERFIFDPGATEAIAEVTASRPSSIVSALPLVRLPFPITWVEWSEYHRPRARPVMDGERKPDKFGFLLEQIPEEPNIILATYAWLHSRAYLQEKGITDNSLRLNVCYYSSFFCPVGSFPLWIPPSEWKIDPSYLEQYGENTREMEAIRSLISVERVAPSRFYKGLIERGQKDFVQRLARAHSSDVVGEGKRVMAAIALLNSRNAVSVDPVDVTRINRTRSGDKLKKLAYSIVKINLSKRQADAAEARGLSAGQMREHTVRGHFKVRKSGIYWWRPFARGNSDEGILPRKNYNVSI